MVNKLEQMQKQKKNFIFNQKFQLNAKFILLANLQKVFSSPIVGVTKKEAFSSLPVSTLVSNKTLCQPKILFKSPVKRRRRNHFIAIRIRPNNMFCTAKRHFQGKVLLARSAGNYKLNFSKKTLKYNSIIILKSFLKNLKKKHKSFFRKKARVTLDLAVPTKSLTAVLSIIGSRLNKTASVRVVLSEKKAFNGCRPKKKKRKKRQGLRVFK